MYIHFHEVRYQNFLASGNEFTTIKLDKSPNTLICGANGNGKSTVLEAITYALYGKAYRNINKPQLINSITKKNMLVELEFSVTSKRYLVRRGMAPGIFEIYCNGELIQQDAAIADYQRNFVNNILRVSERSFRQIIVLGSASYQPFMSLAVGSRRAIIEDLLDINIFTTMNNILKDKVYYNKQDIIKVESELKIIVNKIDITQRHIASLKQNNDELIARKKQKIEEVGNEIAELSVSNDNMMMQIEGKSENVKDIDKLVARHKKLMEGHRLGLDKIKKFNKEIEFFHDNENCPTCKQGIDHDFRNDFIDKKKSKIDEFNDIVDKLKIEESDIGKQISSITVIQDEISDLNQKIFRNNQHISMYNKSLKEIEKEIEELKIKHTSMIEDGTDLKAILKERKEIEKRKEQVLTDQAKYDVCATMLKDSGIKTKIIRQYIPIMNKLINKYLASLDFFCEFELDESFTETIKSRGRDTFTYNSFSEGEKQRINLAILFSWRAISKMRNSVSTNLLFLDETFDSSTDSMGGDAIMNIIIEDLKDCNVFVISHNEKLYDKFHSVIQFAKERGFSKIVGVKN